MAVPQETGTEESKLHDAVTADATAVAPEAIAATVLSVIQRERQKTPDPAQPQPDNFPSFHILRQLDPTQQNENLRIGLLAELKNVGNSPQQLAALLEFLLRAKVDAAREYALQLFVPWPSDQARRSHALSAAVALLEFDGLAAWPDLWRVISADGEFGREVFLRAAHHHRIDAGYYAGIGEAQLADLYVWLEDNFPRSDDPHQAGDGAHWMSPRDSVVQLRDGVLGVLVGRGTPAAVAALRTVMARLPNETWLAYRLIDADQIMRQRTWLPLTPAQVLRLVESPEGRLVQSVSQLADALLAALRKYERELHGQQTPVRTLWDRQADGSWRPVDEDSISDQVKLFLERELVSRGIVLNREVEIGRVPGAPIGSRTDIRVDAIRKAENGESYDVITAVIETKGCWNPQLKTAIKTQLHDDYLTRLGAPVGIYLVGWFDKSKWDQQDSRRKRSPAWDVPDAQRNLDQRAAALSGGFLVRAVVLDCHAP